MKKNIWRMLQITGLILAIFTTYNSILTLNSGASYCSGMYCESNNDCGIPCFCNSLDFTCYNPSRSTI